MAGLAGCAALPSRESTSGEGHSTAGDGPTRGAGDGPTRDDAGCPPYAPDADGAVCSHTVDTDAAPVFLLPSPTVADSVDALDLTLHNDSPSPLEFNPYSWTLHERRDDGWTRIDRQSSGSGTVTVDAGATHRWPFAVVLTYFGTEAPLPPGDYAAELPVPDGDDWLRCVAVFELR